MLNSTTFHHHIPDDEPEHLTPEAIETFLEAILNESATVGSSFINLKGLKIFQIINAYWIIGCMMYVVYVSVVRCVFFILLGLWWQINWNTNLSGLVWRENFSSWHVGWKSNFNNRHFRSTAWILDSYLLFHLLCRLHGCTWRGRR